MSDLTPTDDQEAVGTAIYGDSYRDVHASPERWDWLVVEQDRVVGRVLAALEASRFTFSTPKVREETVRLRAQIAAVLRLCDETDIETHEATQAWLVGNIRAALTPEAGS